MVRDWFNLSCTMVLTALYGGTRLLELTTAAQSLDKLCGRVEQKVEDLLLYTAAFFVGCGVKDVHK